jgi:hypothetical protein
MARMTRAAIAIVVLFVGCAPAAPNAPSSTLAGRTTSPDLDAQRTTHPQDDLTCKDEVPTGTHLERRKCRSDAERTQDRQVLEQTWLNPEMHRRSK